MKSFLKFAKTSGIYFFGTVLAKLVTMLLLRVYTEYIPTGDMGTYNVSINYITFLCSVLYLDIWSGILRYFYDYHTPEGQRKPINCGFAIFGISTILYTVILVLFGQFADVQYLPLIYLYGLMMNLQNLLGYVARAYGKNVLYASAGLLNSFVTAAMNIVLIVGLRMDYRALYVAGCVGYLSNIVLIAVGVKLWTLIRPSAFEKALFFRMFRFSLPLCVNSAAYWFLTSYNSVAVSRMLGMEANGLYAVATRFGSFVSLFTSCFTMAWQEVSYAEEASSRDSRSQFYTSAVNAYLRFMGMGAEVLLPFIWLIFPLMIADGYSASRDMVPLYLLATIASSVSGFLGNIFTAMKKNGMLFYTTVAGSVVNILGVQFLIPRFGVQGASAALFLGFLTIIVFRIFLLWNEVAIRIDVRFLVVLSVVLAVSCGIYFRGDFRMNAVFFPVSIALFLLSFREMIGNLFRKIKK
ncbi:MAG TPA: polysaccharide biosynthesis C-terminal domain-containing protein [Candidatus Fusicatenibacter merdavium]|uniref:Polysaccharide biosynthesis C-terminal domain-containing protein n=1 Tax=Candidatus Fusicatenibacter merdavium TaxID=2838600 RepID=A0A9D1XER7_9FIRM|nr:polysaccharide biosynthesis C-terminal domain-containing protein [Candidatus Fusicatenibacter merdavium]